MGHGNYPCQAGQQSYRDRNLLTNLQSQFYLNPLSVSIGHSDNRVEKKHSQKGGFLNILKCVVCVHKHCQDAGHHKKTKHRFKKRGIKKIKHTSEQKDKKIYNKNKKTGI